MPFYRRVPITGNPQTRFSTGILRPAAGVPKAAGAPRISRGAPLLLRPNPVVRQTPAGSGCGSQATMRPSIAEAATV
jgi:hypothetical protein